MPTYRVLVRGKFDRPAGAVREKLLARASDGDLSELSFSETGSLTFPRHLGGFTFRVLVTTEDAQRAHEHAQLVAMELLDREGYPYRDLTVSSTCLDDVRTARR